MALDQHYGGYSPTCPICQAKILLNGIEDAIILPFHLEVAYYTFIEGFHIFAIPVVLSFQNRAPPHFSLS